LINNVIININNKINVTVNSNGVRAQAGERGFGSRREHIWHKIYTG